MDVLPERRHKTLVDAEYEEMRIHTKKRGTTLWHLLIRGAFGPVWEQYM
ncbi:hypothetical protein [Pseudoflavonifractor phocaeensis]|nr:hypothetical protein [Pseudoflavonifractor phocaeensis]MCQ4864631.1 hypothetical protein [Pseudoflavonifractor phocaeensis]